MSNIFLLRNTAAVLGEIRALVSVVFLCILFCHLPAMAQKEANNWYFGTNAGISFNNGVRSLTNGMLYTDEGCAAMSDKVTGDLMFYTDGVRVWNRNHQIMPNGTGLQGHSTSTQSALIVPHPGVSGQYYIFNPGSTIQNNIVSERLVYSIVDMSLNNGLGDVISKNTMLINTGVSEKVTATIDCSAKGYWLLAHHHSEPIFYAFKIDSSGINTLPVISEAGEFSQSLDYMIGQMKFSPNGRKIAVAAHHPTIERGGFELFDFDFTTGQVSSAITLQRGENYYGASFSPNSTKLYGFSDGASIRISQYNVALPTPAEIINSRRFLTANLNSTGALQLAPNYQILIPRGNTVWAIDSPDDGVNSRVTNFLSLGGRQTQFSLPNFIDNLFLRGKKGLTCAEPVTYFSGGTIICEGRYATFTEDSDNFPTDWSWSFPGGVPDSFNGKTPPPILYEERGEYVVTLTTSNSYGASVQELHVTVVAEPDPIVINDTAICLDTDIYIGGAGESGVTYSWTPTKNLSSHLIPNPSARFSTAGTYTYIVAAQRASDCITYDTVNITVHPLPVANAGRDTSACVASAFTIGTQGVAGLRYEWNPKTGLSDPFAARTIATVPKTTSYILTVTNENGCKSSDTMVITIKGIPKVFKDYSVKICLGSSTPIGIQPEMGISYQWTPAAGLSNPNIANPVASPTATTTYRLRAVDQSGMCSNEALVTVVVGNVQGTISPDTTICLGSSVELWATGGTNYEWSPAIGLSKTNIPNPVATPTMDMVYTVFISDGQCSDTAIVKVYVRKIERNIAGKDITLCENGIGQIGLAPKSGIEYKWSPDTGLSSPHIAAPFVFADQLTENPMRYIVTAWYKDDKSCISVDTVFVKIGEIEAGITDDTIICKGSSVELIAEGGSEYVWSPAKGLSSTTGDSVVASPESTTEYTVIVSSGTCRDTAKVTITVLDMPSAFAGPDKIICLGESVSIGESAKPGIEYVWTPDENMSNARSANPTVTPGITTQYIVEARNSIGCVAWDTVVVQVGELLAVDAGSDTAICNGAHAQLHAKTSSENILFRWTPETGLSDPDIADPIATPLVTTMYYVRATNENGLCTAIDSVLVTIVKNPEITTTDVSVCPGESVQLQVQSDEPDLTYRWTPSDGLSRTDIVDPIATVSESTTYVVTATNSAGCTVTKEVHVVVTSKDSFSAFVKTDRDSLEPGESFNVEISIHPEIRDEGVYSLKGVLRYDPSVFLYTPESIRFIQGADATWSVTARQDQPGSLLISVSGQNLLKDVSIGLELTAYLAKQIQNSIIFSIDKINEKPLQAWNCLTVQTTGKPVSLKEVCAGDMRLISVSGLQYSLSQNSPNPAGSETEIEYSIALAGNASVILYNSIGEVIQVLKEGFHQPGEYPLKIPTSDLPSGIYYYRLISGPFTAKQAMIISK